MAIEKRRIGFLPPKSSGSEPPFDRFQSRRISPPLATVRLQIDAPPQSAECAES
jgi:hypothetical protein